MALGDRRQKRRKRRRARKIGRRKVRRTRREGRRTRREERRASRPRRSGKGFTSRVRTRQKERTKRRQATQASRAERWGGERTGWESARDIVEDFTQQGPETFLRGGGLGGVFSGASEGAYDTGSSLDDGINAYGGSGGSDYVGEDYEEDEEEGLDPMYLWIGGGALAVILIVVVLVAVTGKKGR